MAVPRGAKRRITKLGQRRVIRSLKTSDINPEGIDLSGEGGEGVGARRRRQQESLFGPSGRTLSTHFVGTFSIKGKEETK